jgi:hypothetical protein
VRFERDTISLIMVYKSGFLLFEARFIWEEPILERDSRLERLIKHSRLEPMCLFSDLIGEPRPRFYLFDGFHLT